MARLARHGRKIIPIIDPGVKFEKGYAVYDRGHRKKAFCQNPQGGEYIGLVWPGETAFPDFSLAPARAWWAEEVKKFAEIGVYGAWLDMNDPSTGPSDSNDMLFKRGTRAHDVFHNQYAHGMAMASREGFLQAHPEERPFLLCRSGSTGTGRYTAIWTGDNFSNYHHLKSSIATTLNLALSGIPFNAPDAGGFGGDTHPQLIRDWYKAGFLFPVFRNHSISGSRRQEPWAFDRQTLHVLRHYIRLRYRLRPYLYQLFIRQELSGEAILRPLFYDFPDSPKLPLGLIDDQFMVGPHILQAPFVQAGQKKRAVVLPGKSPWFDTGTGRWIASQRVIRVVPRPMETPLYIRDGSILPLARLAEADHAFHGDKVDFHIYLSDHSSASTRYVFDDGHSFAYQMGTSSEVEIKAQRADDRIAIETKILHAGMGSGSFVFTTEAAIRTLTINGKKARRISSQGVKLGLGAYRTWAA
jgi:alpha-glucosidase